MNTTRDSDFDGKAGDAAGDGNFNGFGSYRRKRFGGADARKAAPRSFRRIPRSEFGEGGVPSEEREVKRAFGKKPFGKKPFGKKPFGKKPFGKKPFGKKPFGKKKFFGGFEEEERPEEGRELLDAVDVDGDVDVGRETRGEEKKGFGKSVRALRKPYGVEGEGEEAKHIGWEAGWETGGAEGGKRMEEGSGDEGNTRERKGFSKKPFGKKPFGRKPFGKKPFGKKPFGKPFGRRPVEDGAEGGGDFGEERPFGKKPFHKKPFGKKPSFGKKPFGKKPFGKKPFGKKPFGKKPGGGRSFKKD